MTDLALSLVNKMVADAALELRNAEKKKESAFANWGKTSSQAKISRDDFNLYKGCTLYAYEPSVFVEKKTACYRMEKQEQDDLAAYVAASDAFKKVGNTYSNLLDLKAALNTE
jgi:hypothetical protein